MAQVFVSILMASSTAWDNVLRVVFWLLTGFYFPSKYPHRGLQKQLGGMFLTLNSKARRSKFNVLDSLCGASQSIKVLHGCEDVCLYPDTPSLFSETINLKEYFKETLLANRLQLRNTWSYNLQQLNVGHILRTWANVFPGSVWEHAHLKLHVV